MKKEDEIHVSAAFAYLKLLLKDRGKSFLPHGFVRDNAGSLQNAITREFGKDQPQVSDSFHFKQNAMMARKGVNKNSAIDECLQWEMLIYMRHKIRLDGLKKGTYTPRGINQCNIKEVEMTKIYERVATSLVHPSQVNVLLSGISNSLKLPDGSKADF